jgi:hypothetical protein
LEASGVPREQAEVHAKTMTTMFLHNLDALVTRDYLDSRFNEFEARIESSIDKRFDGVDKRFGEVGQRFVGVDKRFAEMDRRFDGVDQRFVEVDHRFNAIDMHFVELESSINVRFERVDGKLRLLFWMQALTIACVVLPVIRDLLG